MLIFTTAKWKANQNKQQEKQTNHYIHPTHPYINIIYVAKKQTKSKYKQPKLTIYAEIKSFT